MFILDGQLLPIDTPFTHNDIRYPSNWLRLASPEERESIGIIEVDEQPRPDDRYYYVSENLDGTFTTAPKDLEQLKQTFISQAKQTAGLMLSQTDWIVIRASETQTEIDPAIKSFRQSIRDYSNQLESAINSCEDVEQLIDATQNWQWPSNDR